MRVNALWWWIDRWRKSTAYTDMTLEEQGAYRNLIDEAALRGGPLPVSERVLAKASGDPLRWKKVRAAVMAHFEKAPDGWHNDTLDQVLAESRRRSDAQARYRHKLHNPSRNGGRLPADNSSGVAADNGSPNRNRPPGPGLSVRTPQTPLKGGHLTRKELKQAEEVRNRVHLGCPHDPRCGTAGDCVQKIAREIRSKNKAAGMPA